MKKIMIIGTIVSTVFFTGCYYYGPCLDGVGPAIEEVRDVSEFSQVANEGSFEVRITEADEFSVLVEAQENLLPIIQTFVSGNTLVIKKKIGTCFRSNSTIVVTITMPQLEGVTNTGSGEIYADVGESAGFDCDNTGSGRVFIDSVYANRSTIRNTGSGEISIEGSYADRITITQSGSGYIDAGTVYNTDEAIIKHSSSGGVSCNLVNGDLVDATLTGSGRIDLYGDAIQGIYSLSSSGRIDAIELLLSEADATSTGSGKIFVYATDVLEVTITGSGDVIYRGDPVISSHITGSGDVRPY